MVSPRSILLLVFFIVYGPILTGCGPTSNNAPDLNVEMLGIFSPPAGATGAVTPLSQEYKVEAITLTDSNGTATNLLTEATSFKIVTRPQIILSTSLDTYKDSTFVKVAIQFNSALKTTTRTASDTASSLTTTNVELAKTFVIEATSSVRMIVKVLWGNIVTKDEDAGTETVGEPSFEIKIE